MKKTIAFWLKTFFGIGFLLVVFVSATATATACACCAEPGTWSQAKMNNDEQINSVIGKLLGNLGSTATLYTTAVGLEDIKGILPAPESEKFTLRRTIPRSLEVWLNFADERGKSGRLSFAGGTARREVTLFEADLRDGKVEGATVLYKEIRVEGAVSGSGIFEKGLARTPTRYRLIFQGSGNNCHNVEDFRNWILQIKGAKADFSFYGDLKAGN